MPVLESPPTPIVAERPLNARARAWLGVRAAFTILLFYLAAALFMVLFGGFAIILALVAVAVARFGLGGYVARLVQVPVRLGAILVRRLWLASDPTYHLALARHDAPALFDMCGDLSRRSGVAPPRSISIEMNVNAWVILRGYLRGAGRTRLGLGFDLLAGLTISEMEAVLAHEMTHARLVQRGFSRWLKKGLARLIQVTTELVACAAAYRQQSAESDLAESTVQVFDGLTRRAARLVATYSRQDEFAADRGAAALCGAAALRSGLARLEVLAERVVALPWSERLARLQPGEAFTAWLVAELAGQTAHAQDAPRHAIDHYSTHPALHDRLNALPADDTPLRDTRPGTALFVDPDGVAGRLVAEIQRVLAKQEKKDTTQRARETRMWCRKQGTNGMAVLGGVVLVIGTLLGLMEIGSEFSPGAMVFAIALAGSGVWVIRQSRYRDRHSLPIPTYGTLLNSRPAETHEELAAAEKAIEAELRASSDREHGTRMRFRRLREASYAALGDRDYLRAHVAARLALELDNDSVEAGLGYIVAAAALGNVQQIDERLGLIRKTVGIRTLSTKWGAAWALSLVDEWGCEGLLQQLHDERPDIATFVLLLALAQLHRGKTQSAIANAEKGLALEPENRAAVVLLVQALLIVGRTSDAAARLDPLQDFARTDIYTAVTLVRLRLMQRDTADALRWAEVVRSLDKEASYLIALGQLFGHVRLAEPAAIFFTAAAEARYVPEANIGLSALASLCGDRVTAQSHLLAALRFEGAKFTKGQTLGGLFHEIVGRLNRLAERRVHCRAWIATLPAGPLGLAERSILVCAPDESMARGHLETIVMAMQGAETPLDLSRVSWQLAPNAQQPDRPVPPGVHSVVG